MVDIQFYIDEYFIDFTKRIMNIRVMKNRS